MSGSRRAAVLVALGALALSSCTSFTEQPPPESWKPKAQLTPQAGPQPDPPGGGGIGGPGPNEPQGTNIPPPNGCVDFNPVVIGTCLDTVTAVAALPGDGSDPTALVGERTTGRILRVRKGAQPELVATIPVDGTTDGGLTGLALSPTYHEDQLLFAYITTPSDNRLVRIAAGDSPKAVLTGIPRGPSGNRGALARDHAGGLILATGDAGTPAASADPASLAGKVLRLNSAGKAADGTESPVISSGLHNPGGVCSSPDGTQTWVTDRAPQGDLLYKIQPGKPLTTPAWSWPERPGVAGCAATSRGIWVAMATAAHLQTLSLAPDSTFTGKPTVIMEGPEGFGRISGLDLVNEQLAVGGTVNKRGGQPVSSDDRAVVIVISPNGGSGGID